MNKGWLPGRTLTSSSNMDQKAHLRDSTLAHTVQPDANLYCIQPNMREVLNANTTGPKGLEVGGRRQQKCAHNRTGMSWNSGRHCHYKHNRHGSQAIPPMFMTGKAKQDQKFCPAERTVHPASWMGGKFHAGKVELCEEEQVVSLFKWYLIWQLLVDVLIQLNTHSTPFNQDYQNLGMCKKDRVVICQVFIQNDLPHKMKL